MFILVVERLVVWLYPGILMHANILDVGLATANQISDKASPEITVGKANLTRRSNREHIKG